jgi:hypothetical protein
MRSSKVLTGAVAAVAALAAAAPSALAKGPAQQVAGTCSAHSTMKLKAAIDDAAIQTEFEVDSNVVGQTWNWRIRDNGVTQFSGTARTVAPSGSFTRSRLLTNQAGPDKINVRATNPATGEVCRAVLTI